MNESPFRTFIELISFDRTILALEQELQKVEHGIRVLHDQEVSLMRDIDQAKTIVHEAKKQVDEVELEMNTLDQAEADKKKRLELVSNNKEYQSIKGELEVIKDKQHELEQGLIDAWKVLETAVKTHDHKKVEFEQQLTKLHGLIQEHQQKKVVILADIDSLNQKRPEKEKNVPQEWLDKYAAMRSRVSNPVVPVVNGSCSACFFRVSEQDLIELRRHKLLQCKDCYRFLYLESPTTSNP
ncbi:MAG TPA: hypothetical protein VFF04_03175 [Candidatus Babeliales bacterium]|nr:hypothetical protein [Candidatus Babeliales bacterium]